MKPLLYKIAFILFSGFCISLPSHAGLFYEHKYIGDQAFIKFVKANHLESFLKEIGFKQFGDCVPIPYMKRVEVIDYYQHMFAFPLSGSDAYSYGDFCGLAGDHTIDPEQLYEGLFLNQLFALQCPGSKTFSSLQQKVSKSLKGHIAGIDNGGMEGSFSSITSFAYALLAIEDRSHFQRPPESFSDMISEIDSSLIKLSYDMYTSSCQADSMLYLYRSQFDKKITHITNAAKYALLHTIALRFMSDAALSLSSNDDTANWKKDIITAFVFNAFGDHFLQDAFAAGHMSVRRSWRGSHNKGTHDYYNRIGLDVHNEMGDSFRTYGDGYYTSQQFKIAIEADAQSIQELWDHYTDVMDKIKKDADVVVIPLYDSLRQNKIDHSQWPNRILDDFGAYKYMPVPLSPQAYQQNKLKSSSKTGMYIGLGYGRFVKGFNNSNNSILSFSTGIILPFTPLWIEPVKDEHQNIESEFCISLAFNYNYVEQGPVSKNQYLFKIPFTFFDKIILEAGIGGSHYLAAHHSLWSAAIAYEWKSLKNFWAPSISYFTENERGIAAMQGVKLNFNLY